MCFRTKNQNNEIDETIKSANLDILYNAVAKNNLVCITGSGVSCALKLSDGKKAPNWYELLVNIRKRLDNKISQNEAILLNELLIESAPGEQLIDAAGILSKIDNAVFEDELQKSVTLAEGAFSEIHNSLIDLEPNGIITYNYDLGHENAYNNRNKEFEVILPQDREKIISVLKGTTEKPFLFKAHGCVSDKESMVLTSKSYQDLFNKYPYYKPFTQNIFTRHQLLIVGFGLSDPDFEMLIQNFYMSYGAPIQDHIVIRHTKEKSIRDITLEIRFGIHFVYVDDYSEIPEILKKCRTEMGSYLRSIMEQSLCNNIDTRKIAHKKIRQLSQVGKNILASALEIQINKMLDIQETKGYDSESNRLMGELVYTYGIIANCANNSDKKNLLIKIVNKSKYSEPVAHALHHLRNLLDSDNKKDVAEWIKKFQTGEEGFLPDPKHIDINNRVLKYCEVIHCVIEAKEASDN